MKTQDVFSQGPEGSVLRPVPRTPFAVAASRAVALIVRALLTPPRRSTVHALLTPPRQLIVHALLTPPRQSTVHALVTPAGTASNRSRIHPTR